MSFIEKFEKSCDSLLEKMDFFEKNFYCKKCKTTECKHMQSEKQKTFKKEIDSNLNLATKVADKVTKIRTQELCQHVAY